MSSSFSHYLQSCQERVNQALEQVLPADTQIPTRLHQAMRYAVLNGGKRIRPALVYATGELFNPADPRLDDVACALELIHAFSLVHDDLPAMDNDVLRRGKPTCHVAFDEATAILAGDALQTLAFKCLSNTNLSIVTTLSDATAKMIAGQEIDICSVGKTLDLPALKHMHECKTGALIVAAVHMSALLNPEITPRQLRALTHYASMLGLAFQVQDDILDVTASTVQLGKTSGKDADNNKPTYPNLLGLEAAKKYALEAYESAINALSVFDKSTERLCELAKYVVYRDY